MKLLKNLIALALIAIALQAHAQTNQIRQFTLPNGLTVILDEQHDQPEVFGLIAVKAGGKNDPADATGMAHYQEHMLFKGTTTLGTIDWEKEKPHIDKIFQLYDSLGKTKDPEKRALIQKAINEESVEANKYAIPNEMNNLLNEMGSTLINAGTGPDYTLYYNKFPASQVERWLDLYAHRFTEPVFRGFQAELEVVYEEKNLYNDQFQTRLLEEFQKYFFKNHPYGQQTIIGTIEDLKNPSLTKMYEFFKTYYVPNNMALILSGDFNSEEIIPIIEDKYGKWQPRELPEPRKWYEAAFNGREFHEAKLSPIKLAILGYRAPNVTDPRKPLLDVTTRLLNNSYSTGLLDKLTLDGKILAAQAMMMPYYDHGAIIFLVVPKVVGQKLEDAEKLVLSEIEKLKKGEFDESLLEAIKLEIYRYTSTKLENIQNRALTLSEAFTQGKSIDEVLAYPEKVKSITKTDIVAIANEVFGPNDLAFYSKMGFPKKEKIAKPDFKPLLSNANARSAYAQHFDSIPVRTPNFRFIDFDKNLKVVELTGGHKLLCVENPKNDIFSLNIEFKVGKTTLPLLEYVSQGMALAGAGDYNVNQLKMEFAKLGSSYSISVSETKTQINISGVESNLEPTLKLVGKLMSNPKLEQSKIKTIVANEKASRKMERSEPDNVANALVEYGLYGQESNYLNRLTMSQLKKLKAEELIDAFKQATGYLATINYCGNTDNDKVSKAISNYLPLASSPKIDPKPLDKPAKQYTENTILFVNKPKARQSKMFVFINGEPFKMSDAAYIDAFNDYFGGGFSGLMLQEIREYRSLAYATGGSFRYPQEKGKPVNFIGYVGTQSDKTLIAMKTLDTLIRQMPEKPERIEMIKSHLELSAQTNRPSFRNIASTVEAWKRRGFHVDPLIIKLPIYRALTWEDIDGFYKKRIKDKPTAYMIVGDQKNIDMKNLAKYGKVTIISEKTLFSK
ncbi:MAG TPA: insulinase family protein [Bacteroidales bacterium]|nr:insulinase family protein [Bacteroidales bacterium]